MTTRPSVNALVFVTSPATMRRASRRKLPAEILMPSRRSSSSADDARNRIDVMGTDWLYIQMWRAISRPYCEAHRCTSQDGCADDVASASGLVADARSSWRASDEMEVSVSFRSTALANGAAERLRARFTSSTLS